MTTTWTYGSKRIEVEAGVVVSSDSPAVYPVGSRLDVGMLRRAGWRKAKAAVQYDGFGRRFGADGAIERK